MSYSYSLLGTACTSKTIASTSNNKFLPLQAPVYFKQHTCMMKYPERKFSDNVANFESQLVPQNPQNPPNCYDLK